MQILWEQDTFPLMDGSAMVTDMSPVATSTDAAPLDTVLLRGELARRPTRSPDLEAENAAYLLLSDELAEGRQSLLQSLMEAAMSLCQAGTAGISLLEPAEDGDACFRWTAVCGRLAAGAGGTTPREFSPCGVCLDHDAPVLFSHPERRFTYFQATGVPFVEGLVLPFYVDDGQAGTIWIISHDDSHGFDMEDVRIMTRLARFTGAAYGALGRGTPVS